MTELEKTYTRFAFELADALLKGAAEEAEEEAMLFRAIVTRNERRFRKELVWMFKKQKEEVLERLSGMKDLTDLFMFDVYLWEINLRRMAHTHLKRAMQENGKRVFEDLKNMGKQFNKYAGAATTFDMDYPEALEYIDEQSLKLAGEVTAATEAAIKETLTQAFVEGYTIDQVSAAVKESFDGISKSRADTIARTEVSRAANYGSLSAYTQSKVVEGKEWLTALDERVCPFCRGMEGEIRALSDSFLEKEAVLEVPALDEDGSIIPGKFTSMTNNYLDCQAPPIHPNCRCTLLPIIKTIP